jgi:signal peptidase II
MKWILFLSLPLYVLDQLSKRWILHHIELGGARPIIRGFFDIVHVTNTGAAFGSFKNNNVFFIALSCVALVSVAVLLLRKNPRPNLWRDLSLALLFGGVLGNLTDRLTQGHVIDFLLFDFGSRAPSILHPWPAFNVADSCICVAVFFFIISSLRENRKPANEHCSGGVRPPN